MNSEIPMIGLIYKSLPRAKAQGGSAPIVDYSTPEWKRHGESVGCLAGENVRDFQ
jgi:hypothetical protein